MTATPCSPSPDSVFTLFLPCAAGCEPLLQQEVESLLQSPAVTQHSGVQVQGNWQDMMRLNLHSRLAIRVMVLLTQQPYQNAQDLYDIAKAVPWEEWFTNRQTLRLDCSAQRSPLKSLHFATLRVKDAVVDRMRDLTGNRPSVNTRQPDVRLHLHVTADTATLYIDTSSEPLFKRGWRQQKGAAPLKETLAAAMLMLSGWQGKQPLLDPCCGSGTIAIEAAQLQRNIAPGLQRSFGFTKLLPHQPKHWQQMKEQAQAAILPSGTAPLVFASDVTHRMVDFATRNAARAGVAADIVFQAADALQRRAPTDTPGIILMNPPYGERMDASGRADPSGFFAPLASCWKQHFGGWTAFVLSPDMKLPGALRLRESKRTPLFNGAIDCRLFRFDIRGLEHGAKR